MNAMSLAATRPLLDMLGARWMVETPVADIAWDHTGKLAAFALGDGTLAMARTAWDGGPVLRPRDTGGVELVPPSKAAPPVARAKVHDGACLSLAADPDGGFLSGGTDGQLARVQPDGVIDTLLRLDGIVASPVASGPGGWRVCAAGRTVLRLGTAPRDILVAAPVEALAVAPDGSRVAIGHQGGVTVWAGGDTPRILAVPGHHAALAWSPDSQWLASATPDGAVQVWHWPDAAAYRLAEAGDPVGSIAFTADSARLTASGSTRIACWRLAPDAAGIADEPCGVGGQERATCVAGHPKRVLIAAGYANGAILLCQPSSREILFVRGTGEGAATTLRWSPDGGSLATGTEDGEIALVSLPDLLFRASATGAA